MIQTKSFGALTGHRPFHLLTLMMTTVIVLMDRMNLVCRLITTLICVYFLPNKNEKIFASTEVRCVELITFVLTGKDEVQLL